MHFMGRMGMGKKGSLGLKKGIQRSLCNVREPRRVQRSHSSDHKDNRLWSPFSFPEHPIERQNGVLNVRIHILASEHKWSSSYRGLL